MALLADEERDLTRATGSVHGPVRVGTSAIWRLVALAITALALSSPAVSPLVVEVDGTTGLKQPHTAC